MDPENNKGNLKTTYNDAYIEPCDFPISLNSTGVPFKPDFNFSQLRKYNDPIFGVISENALIENCVDSKLIENMNYTGDLWIAYVFAGFQSGKWRKDGDPLVEKENDPIYPHKDYKLNGYNLGLTSASSSSIIGIVNGGSASIIPFENFRDTGFQSFIGRSIAHEIGHQFGFGHHEVETENLMNSTLNDKNNGKFLRTFINLLRSRKYSPGN